MPDVCTWPADGSTPEGVPGSDYEPCHKPGSGHVARLEMIDGGTTSRSYVVCSAHMHTAAGCGWVVRLGGPLGAEAFRVPRRSDFDDAIRYALRDTPVPVHYPHAFIAVADGDTEGAVRCAAQGCRRRRDDPVHADQGTLEIPADLWGKVPPLVLDGPDRDGVRVWQWANDHGATFEVARDRVRAGLDEALARRAAEVEREARRLTPVDSGPLLRSYGRPGYAQFDEGPRSIPAPRFRDAAPDVPVLVAGVVLGAAVGLTAFGWAWEALEARVAAHRAARAARKGWSE